MIPTCYYWGGAGRGDDRGVCKIGGCRGGIPRVAGSVLTSGGILTMERWGHKSENTSCYFIELKIQYPKEW